MPLSLTAEPEIICLNGPLRLKQTYDVFVGHFANKYPDDTQQQKHIDRAFGEIYYRLKRGERLRALGPVGDGSLPQPPEHLLTEVEWYVLEYIWKPWLARFRDRRWIAKGF